jgi:carboxypeptidase C (cathepsin A)
MAKNPNMKVMFCNGSADLATPYLAADFTIRHMDLSDALRANITHKIYQGGHMLYHYQPSRQKLGEDVRAFIRDAAPIAPAPTTQAASAQR